MERSIAVNENHQRRNSTPASKSLGSLIKIDSISIDLAGAMEKNEAGKCEHFSIRGYVAEMRKKDRRICLPFALDGNNKLEEQTSMLPPLHVAKFKWWHCQNCLWEIGATSTAEETGIVPNCCKSGFISSSTCSLMQSHGDAVMVLSDVQKASKLDNFEGRKDDFITYSNVNRDEHCFSSCRFKKEMKAEKGNNTAAIGHENDSEDDANREIYNPTCDVTKFNPCLLQERHTDGKVALKSKGNGLMESCEPNCGSHEVAVIVPAIETLNCTGRSSAEICQKGKLTSAYDQKRNVLTSCKTDKVVGKIDEVIDAVKDQTSRLPSLELEVCDNVSSESNEILAGNGPHDWHHNNSSGLISRKTRKVRLLTELLGAKQKAKNDHIRTEGASSNALPDVSAGLRSLSPQNQVPVEGNLSKGFRGTKRKTKMPQYEDWKPLEISCPNNVTKKFRVFKGGAETTNTSIEIGSEEDASAGVVLQTDLKSQCKHRINRNPTQGRKKNKESQVGNGYSPLVSWQGVVPEKNQIKIGDADKCGVAADIGLPKSAHDAFTGRGQQLYLKSYLSPQQTEINLSFCKKKNKMPQVDDGQDSLTPKRNSMLGEGLIIRKDVEIMTGPEGVEFQSEHDASAKKGLDLSLNSYMAVQRTDINYFAQIEDGIDPLLPQKKGITREDHCRWKDVMYVGESSRPHKSAPDPSFDKGLLCDLNERIAHRTSFLREMQNCDPLVEDGSFSLHQKLDISDTCNNEKTIEVQEHSEVIKKHSDQRVDKVFEQGPLDDIPMDIVELMAKNQYDRLHESERNYCLSERKNNKRNAEIMVFPEVHRNRVLGSLQEENPHKRKPVSGNAKNVVITACENVGSSKQNPVNYFSQINRNHFNMGKLEGNPAFTGFSTFSQRQEKLSGGVQYSASGSIRNSCTQNCKWNGDNVVPRSSRTNKQVLEVCNTCQNGLRQNEEAEHVRSSTIPNHMLFGLNIPQKCATQSSNIEMHSECPDTLHKGEMIEDLDMNFLNLSATNLEKQNRNFDSESFKRTSAKYPFDCKHRVVELKTKGMGSLDLYPNETIPAMQLLSLMDAGMQSSTPVSLDGKPKFFDKSFFPCDHHPNAGLDMKSKFLEKPFLPCDHHSKEFSVLGTGVYKASDNSRRPSSAFYGKNLPSEKSCECSPAFGAFGSLFQNDGYCKRAAGFTGRVSSKSQEQERAKSSYSPTQNRGRRSQKSVCTSGVAGTSRASNTVQDKRKGFLGAPDSVVSPLQRHRIEDSAKHNDLEARGVNGFVSSMKNISKIDICSVNTNPADFTIPEAGNGYMISGEDLKFGKKITSKDRSGLINVDGRKRQRVTKLASMKKNAQHHVS